MWKLFFVLIFLFGLTDAGDPKKKLSDKKKSLPVPAEMTISNIDLNFNMSGMNINVTSISFNKTTLTENMTDAANSLEANSEDSLDEELVAEADTISIDQKSSKKCAVKDVLVIMADHLKNLEENVRAMKKQMFEKCPGFKDSSSATSNSTDYKVKKEKDSAGNNTSTADETEMENNAAEDKTFDDGPSTTPPPPIPQECTPPFQLVAGGCYYFLYSPADWRSWGDANAYCQTLKGTLATPRRFEELQKYLLENFSNVYWVGAKKSADKKSYKWLNGNELKSDDFRGGKPAKAAAKFCVYLEFFSGYKAVNHYCGEKFSFICEEKM